MRIRRLPSLFLALPPWMNTVRFCAPSPVGGLSFASPRFTTLHNLWHVVHRVARLRRACFGGEDRSNRV